MILVKAFSKLSKSLRYGLAWLLTKVVCKVLSYITAAIALLTFGVIVAALWFSPEYEKAELDRLDQ